MIYEAPPTAYWQWVSAYDTGKDLFMNKVSFKTDLIFLVDN